MGRGLLILVSGLFIIVGLVQQSISNRIIAIPERTVDYHQETDVQNVANSVLEYGMRELDNDQQWNAGLSENDFMGAEATLQVFNFQDFVNNNPNIPADHDIQNWDQWTLLLVSTAETNSTKAVVEAHITQDSFSRYAFFSNNENGVFFTSTDVVNGPVHTNGTLNFSGTPTFNGPVSSPNMWNGTANPQFNGPANFSAQQIPLPTDNQANQLRNQAQNGGLSFNSNIDVIFNNDGTVNISENGNPPVNYDLNNRNGVISSSGTVTVEGTVNGQATIHSSSQVQISGDITYQDPGQNSSDVLGVVSQGDITVQPNAHRASGNQDLTIHASMMAIGQGNSFRLSGFNDGTVRGTLNLLGGIQQDTRGPVGQFRRTSGGGSVLTSGFAKNYSFDTRLSQMNPPSYPRQSTFSIQYVKEKPVEFL